MFAKINHVAMNSANWPMLGRFYEAVFGLQASEKRKSRPISGANIGDGYVGLNINPLRDGYVGGLDHFGLALREGVTRNDLACAMAGLIEGVWLNQCLAKRHPFDKGEPVNMIMRRGGRLLWLGATVERG